MPHRPVLMRWSSSVPFRDTMPSQRSSTVFRLNKILKWLQRTPKKTEIW